MENSTTGALKIGPAAENNTDFRCNSAVSSLENRAKNVIYVACAGGGEKQEIRGYYYTKLAYRELLRSSNSMVVAAVEILYINNSKVSEVFKTIFSLFSGKLYSNVVVICGNVIIKYLLLLKIKEYLKLVFL